MRLVEVIQSPDAASRTELIDFVGTQTERLGARPMSDHLWLDLRSGSPDLLTAGVHESLDTHGRSAGRRTLALAQISATNESSTLELVVDESTAGPDDVDLLTRDLAETIIDEFRRSIPAGRTSRLSWWTDEPSERTRELAADLGLSPIRQLHEMRRPLPAERHATVATRPFRPGLDDAAFLSVNNRAFADHGEQGGWTRDTLALRLAEPWFDPDGFRLHDIDGRVAAFCWTKVHQRHDPPMGEIYAIAVDPDFHGRGLGSELTLAGLDWIHGRGIELAALYVDGDNSAAMRTYERLGFHVHRTRWAFAGDLHRQADR
jgi:mycothiol synthase